MSKSEIRQFFARIGIQLTDWQFERVYELLNPKLIKNEENTVIGKIESVTEEYGGIRIIPRTEELCTCCGVERPPA